MIMHSLEFQKIEKICNVACDWVKSVVWDGISGYSTAGREKYKTKYERTKKLYREGGEKTGISHFSGVFKP